MTSSRHVLFRIGGEDFSMATEIEILQQAGHHVDLLQWHNSSMNSMSTVERLSLFWRSSWNGNAYGQVQAKLKAMRAELLYVQNFFPFGFALSSSSCS